MVPAITTPFKADMPPRGFGEGAHHLRGDGLAAGVLKHGLGALGSRLRLIADGLEAVDTVLERRVVQVGDACLDGVVEALEARFSLRRTPVQFANVLTLTLGSLLSPVEHGGEDRFQPLRLEETVFDMAGDKIVQLVHRRRHTFAGCRPLPGVLLQGADDVLGVLLGLILVEQRHDLPHHDVHGIIAHLLGDGDELHPVLGELPDVEFQLEVIAEKAAERMDDHHVERRGLRRARLDHPLKLGAPIIGGRCARLHIGFDELVAARLAIGFTLALLIGDRDIMLGLPRRRDAQVKGRAGGLWKRPCRASLCGSLVRRQHADAERQEMLRVAGDDDEFMRCGGPGNHGVSHAGVVTGRKRLRFQPPADCGGLRIEANDLVIVCGNKATEPCFQARGFRRCSLVVEERDSLLDLMDGDDRQK
jgi:hypothetical protein